MIGKVAGSSATVVRDVSNASAGRDICTLSPSGSWRFAGEMRVSLAQPERGRIIVADLASGRAGKVTEWAGGGFASGTHAWSPDGTSLTYLVSDPSGLRWHLYQGGTDRVIADLPPIPGRGVSNIQDDLFLEYAPDGRHLALVETFATGGTGEKAPVQVRSADGTLVYSAESGRMGVWASQPSRLYFRSLDGQVTRWDPTAGAALVASGIIWVRPRASRDGTSIAYSSGGPAEIPDFHLFSVRENAVAPGGHSARAESRFIGPGLIWYVAAVPCQCPLTYLPGEPYVYEVSSGSESATRLLSVDDVWQR